MSTPLVVTAHLDTPTIGLLDQPVMLDGPLAWAAAMAAHARGDTLDPITRHHAPDLPLPLTRWEQAGTWGWCTSAATLDITSHTATEIRRKPATAAMARYTRDRKHHAALGPYKARDTTLAAAIIRTATWHIITTDEAHLHDLLALITHLGAHHAIGHGHIAQWATAPDPDPDAWQARPMPTPGAPARAYRAPYHHASRQVAL